jgi:ribosomal-protein-alanine N-acetyltransferase
MARQGGGDGSTSEVTASIRFAAEGDLNGILEIERLSFPIRKQWGYGDFQAALRDLFFVFLDGKISGFLIASCWEDTKRAMILRIAVHPDYRNRGIATRLIEAAIEKFNEMDIREVEIDVEIVKRGAIHLYERVGFQTLREIPMRENNTMNDENGSFYRMKMVIEKP